MKKNVGKLDKVIRVVLAMLLFSMFFFLEGDSKFLAIAGVVPLVTGLFSFCPLYRIFGFSTCLIKSTNQ